MIFTPCRLALGAHATVSHRALYSALPPLWPLEYLWDQALTRLASRFLFPKPASPFSPPCGCGSSFSSLFFGGPPPPRSNTYPPLPLVLRQDLMLRHGITTFSPASRLSNRASLVATLAGSPLSTSHARSLALSSDCLRSCKFAIPLVVARYRLATLSFPTLSLYNRFRLAPSPLCRHGCGVDETVEHIVASCPSLSSQRSLLSSHLTATGWPISV